MAGVQLRLEQKRIIEEYTHGKAGIAAVPGSGKTFTLAHLAARLIADRRIGPDQEALVVTFTNSAVNSFQARIARILREQYHLLPGVSYRVRTLHGLAHDIVRERPALVGLDEDFAILDERLSAEIQRDLAVQRLSEWWDRLSVYFQPDGNPKKLRFAFERDVPDLVASFIKRAKDLRYDPDDLLRALSDADNRFDFVRFATAVYADYQRSLAYRGAVDFDDLVRLALRALEMDDQYLQRLHTRWPYILEDEAQDSTRLQEEMLSLLSGGRNWVRVGDPNQAINTTFTTANPRFLFEFLESPDVEEYPLSVSGRSAPPIVDLANELVRWTVEEHPTLELRDAFDLRENKRRRVRRGKILPTPNDDPQPNPLAEECFVHFHYEPGQHITPDKELDMVVAGEEFALVEWLAEQNERPQDQRPTVAVLVPENSRGFQLAEKLRKYGVKYEELLRSTTATRQAVALLQAVLDYLADSTDLKTLKQLYWVLMSQPRRDLVKDGADLRQAITKLFSRFRNVEQFLWPLSGDDLALSDVVPEVYAWLLEDLAAFRALVRRWLEAMILPVDQLVLTISQDVFVEPVDVALGYKVAVLLRDMARVHPEWRLPEFVGELRVISSNERKFIGFDDDVGYTPEPGVVTIATMHAAKGLEWDRVYLMAVNSYDFPSVLIGEVFRGERWYARDGLNLQEELLAQLELLVAGDFDSYREGVATYQARFDYAKERLRLLYVAITRARRELIVTWNVGKFWQDGRQVQPALSLVVLEQFRSVSGSAR